MKLFIVFAFFLKHMANAEYMINSRPVEQSCYILKLLLGVRNLYVWFSCLKQQM